MSFFQFSFHSFIHSFIHPCHLFCMFPSMNFCVLFTQLLPIWSSWRYSAVFFLNIYYYLLTFGSIIHLKLFFLHGVEVWVIIIFFYTGIQRLLKKKKSLSVVNYSGTFVINCYTINGWEFFWTLLSSLGSLFLYQYYTVLITILLSKSDI